MHAILSSYVGFFLQKHDLDNIVQSFSNLILMA